MLLKRTNVDGPWKRQFDLETKRTSICEKNMKYKQNFKRHLAPNIYRIKSSTDLMEREYKGKFSSLERFRREKEVEKAKDIDFNVKNWMDKLKNGDDYLKFGDKIGGKFDKAEKPSIFTKIGMSVPPKMNDNLAPNSYKVKELKKSSHQGKMSKLSRFEKKVGKMEKEQNEKFMARPMTSCESLDVLRPKTAGFVKFGLALERSDSFVDDKLPPNYYSGNILKKVEGKVAISFKNQLPRFGNKRRGLTDDIGFYELQKKPVYYRPMSRIK